MVGNPALEFSVLGSGSKGNCVLVEGGGTAVLIDAGFSLKNLKLRLAELGREGVRPSALLITHEHLDHIQHTRPLVRHFDMPVLVNEGTLGAWPERLKADDLGFEVFRSGDSLRIGALDIRTIAKAHDASEPVSIVVEHGDASFGCFTDLGSVDEVTLEAMRDCDALLFEANHDPGMLMKGRYPAHLQRRVGGRFGHLSNDDAARALRRLESERLGCLVLGHLSGENNDPRLVRDAFVRHGGASPAYERWISYQDRPLGSFAVRRGSVQRLARAVETATGEAAS